MKKPVMIIAIVVITLAIIGGGVVMYVRHEQSVADAADSASVRATVTGFGSKMQMVSLLAPSTTLAQAMHEDYSAYVSPVLIAQWLQNPALAAGRMISSPWPDHIQIISITKNGSAMYTVTGNVVEMTSNEVEHGGFADEYPVTITVQKEHGSWLITQWINNGQS